ncbi:DUF2971 domain-containing protein [uncultured Cedecea sp.]|uniref:DUF2971 domain-containing protein n=1 Tax=uncultured Cedecea sp. TaxID=988762 RepID=UPI00262A107F|nr:DUF2971 domain-containing protein [uncultured Cedecea sp.]
MENNKLRRYTNLPSLLCMLTTKEITLLDPKSWDDKNDSYFLDIYTNKRKLAKTLALCMTKKNETYHHWSVFTQKDSGVCIVFDFNKFKAHLDEQENIIHGHVSYMTLKQIRRTQTINIDKLPFLKRHAFTDESEYRLIYPSSEDIVYKKIPLPINAISRISVSPWMPKPFFEVIRKTVNNISGCKNIRVSSSSLIDNTTWKEFGDNIKIS